jgi:hypothetical protein
LEGKQEMEVSSPLAQDYFARMTEAEWKDLYKRARLYSYMNYGWLQSKIGGLVLEDVIIDAIEDIYFGTRQWPVLDKQGRDKKVSLCVFVCQTIRSKVSHILEKEKRRGYQDEGPEAEQSEFLAELMRAQTIYGPDQRVAYQELCERLLDSVSDDPFLTRIVRRYIETPDLEPRDLAKQMKLPVTEIRNALKRLSRRLRSLREEWPNG